MDLVAKLQEQVELLGEKGVIVLHGEAEQRIGLAERSAPDDDLGASFRDEVERREFLKDADRIGGAEHGDGAGQADLPRPRGGGGQDHSGRRVEEFLAMMFADAEHIEPDTVGDLHFVEQTLHPFGGRNDFPRRRIGDDRREAVDADFHAASSRIGGRARHVLAAPFDKRPSTASSRREAFSTPSA